MGANFAPASIGADLLASQVAETLSEIGELIDISQRLHESITEIVEALRVRVPIALSGGVFQNRLLLEQVIERLQAKGHKVLTHRTVPANDGGLALGQAVIAAAQMLGS